MIIGDGIMLGAGGETASIFVTGLSETDTVTASKDGKTVVGKWTQIHNPASVVPDGYTQLEYIQSSGTQYIDTGFGKNTGVFVVHSKFSFQNVSPDNYSAYYLCGSNVKTGSVKTQNLAVGIINNGGDIKLRAAAGNMVIDNGPKFFNSAPVANMVYEITHTQDNANKTLKAVCGDYEESYNFTGTPTNNSMWLFALNGSTSRSNMRLYSYTLLVDGTTVRDFVPSKRISDGVIGLYDKENDVFYTNAGTGTFMAGPEIPQTIDGFMISKIKDYGTWTVMATNGTKTATQDVMVDAAIIYEIVIKYVTDKTFTTSDFESASTMVQYSGRSSYSKLTNQYNGTDGLKIYGTNNGSSDDGAYLLGFPSYVLKADLTGYSTLAWHFKKVNDHGAMRVCIVKDAPTTSTLYSICAKSYFIIHSNTPTSWTEYTFDISELDGEYYLLFQSGWWDTTGNANSEGWYSNIRLLV